MAPTTFQKVPFFPENSATNTLLWRLLYFHHITMQLSRGRTFWKFPFFGKQHSQCLFLEVPLFYFLPQYHKFPFFWKVAQPTPLLKVSLCFYHITMPITHNFPEVPFFSGQQCNQCPFLEVILFFITSQCHFLEA